MIDMQDITANYLVALRNKHREPGVAQCWLMSREVYRHIRRLKDDAQNPVYPPSLDFYTPNGELPPLLGLPVIVDPCMGGIEIVENIAPNSRLRAARGGEMTDITAGSLITMCAKYAGDASATWRMSPKIFKCVRDLKDSAGVPCFDEGPPPTLLGIPVWVDDDFDSINIFGRWSMSRTHDPVEHPTYDMPHPSGIECIQITEHMGFNLGNALTCIWHADLKHDDALGDLRKAKWYIEREIAKRGK